MKRFSIFSIFMSMGLSVAFPGSYIVMNSDQASDHGHLTFNSISEAIPNLSAGDTLLIYPGSYKVDPAEIAKKEKPGPYAVVYDLSMSGEDGSPIVIKGVADEQGNRPVVDFSEVTIRDEEYPDGYRITGFLVSGSYIHISDLECVGLQVTRTDHTQSENFRIDDGSFNTLENISIHDGMGIGVYIKGNSHHNLVVNCDAFNNYDPVSDISRRTGEGSGGNNDGFGCHVNGGMEGNKFIGCRAWRNSDDGFDLINCYSPVEFSYCVAMENGYDAEGKRRADGNGVKAGGFGMRPKDIPLHEGLAPRHNVSNCIAAANKASGIYSNHHLGGIDFINNTSYLNGRSNYSMVNRKGPEKDANVDVNGYGYTLRSNLSLSGGEIHTQWVSEEPSHDEILTEGIDKEFDYAPLYDPRQSDGMLSEEFIKYAQSLRGEGKGADFSGYPEDVVIARKVTGANVSNK